jgi:transcriptional regulator with XRE-family HTH domain
MEQWRIRRGEPDLEVLEESALATAQATIQGAIDAAHLSRAELARKMGCKRSFVSRMLSGDHNLTIRTMARATLACGFEIEMKRKPICWNWVSEELATTGVPAKAGTLVFAA